MGSGPPTWFLIGTLIVALLAPTVAFIAATRQVASALKVAREQATSAERVAQKGFQGTVVAANRQRWLDELRSDVASFVADVQTVKAKRAPAGSEELRAVTFAFARIRMRINSSKSDQKYLVEQMQAIMSDVNSADLNAKLEALMNGVEVVAAGVWRKVKAGD